MLHAETARRPLAPSAEHRTRTVLRELREMALRLALLRIEEADARRMAAERADRPGANLTPLTGKINRLARERKQLARQLDVHLTEFRSLALGPDPDPDPETAP